MQFPPLTFMDINLLFMVGAIVLLTTAELASPYYGQTKLAVKRQKLKNAAYAVSLFFLITVLVQIIIILFY